MDEQVADCVVYDTAADNQRVRRHRARHTKSRNGCHNCKLRRVKCDELQPACGTCASRGEPCSYPRPCVSSKKTLRRRREKVGDDDDGDRSPIPDSLPPSDGGAPAGSTQSLVTNATLPAIFSRQSTHGYDNLPMDDLKLLQFFHLYTANRMTLHPRRAIVWQRIMPEFGSKNPYLMHLILALGGIHMITQQAEANRDGEFEDRDMVDLAIVVEHHQRGLEGFRQEVSCISPSNAELVLTGSLLLVGFAFASLKVQKLNPLTGAPEDITGALGNSSTNDILRLNWLYLNRGVSSVIHDQWHTLKASRLRQMLVYSHDDGFWKDLVFDPPSSRLSRCSPRLLKFAEGASQAVARIKASLNALEPPEGDLSSCSGPSTSQPSPHMTLNWAMDAHFETIGILDKVYSRILATLRCAATESSVDREIQMDFEEAAILSWPVMLPSPFLVSLEQSEHNRLHGHSLVLLAHFFLVNTLVDSWFLRGSFEGEILKVNALIGTLNESVLSTILLWPSEVIDMPPTCTP